MTDAPPNGEEQLPQYVIEGARSSRSKCKTCRRAISKGTLRIGMLIEGPFGTGYLWHHLNCAARRSFERVEEAYELEAWREAKDPPERVPTLESLAKTREQSEERRKKRKEIPYVEEAPSGRSRCKQCGELIDKGALRVTLGRRVEFGSQVRTSPFHVHPRCVAAAVDDEECATEAEGLEALLREHSPEIPTERMDALIVEIG